MKLKDIHEFNYDRISREMWDKKLQHAMKKFGISFDTENNDKIDEKTITIEQKHWETTKCQIICQAWAAGGDWETSTMYFKCQVKEGYFNIDGESMMSDAFFIFIPDNKNGNYQLEESDSGLMPIGDDDNEEDV